MRFPGDPAVYETRLREIFGFESFRGGQLQVLTALADADVVAVMPTGSGKSLCFVLPALEVGRTLVVSPLIALMQDQVESLQRVGIAATFINSTLDRAEQDRRYRDFVDGRVPILYVAPERLADKEFTDGLARAGIHLLAIDEAHCISAWGHSFRSEYLQLGSIRARLGRPRTLALTATATPQVRRDMATRLGIADSCRYVVTSVDRPNLTYEVRRTETAEARQRWVIGWVSERRRLPGIIYASTRKGTEDMARALRSDGIHAEAYHAGLCGAERSRIQHEFTAGSLAVIVATNAFGMGVDKPDVRYVVHLNMPGRLEAYYQEAGRAGRDGKPSECVLFYGRRDRQSQEYFINLAHPSDVEIRETWRRWIEAADRSDGTRPFEIVQREDGAAMTRMALRASGLLDADALRLTSFDPNAPIDTSAIREHRIYEEDRLDEMVEYAESTNCRRALILRYFGEAPPTNCGRCDNCLQSSTRPLGRRGAPDARVGARTRGGSPPGARTKASTHTSPRPFVVGDRVTDEKFGAGFVTMSEMWEGDQVVTVRFSEGRPRRLSVRLARLQFRP